MVLFLDFDGPLHPDAVYRSHKRPLELRAPGELFMHAPILETILEDYPSLKIVLSTSWVRTIGYERTLRKMPEKLRVRVCGATWHKSMRHGLNDPSLHLTRYQQIANYVSKFDIKEWIAIDDLHSGGEEWPANMAHRIVLVDPNKGLGDPDAQEMLKQKLKINDGSSIV